MTNLSLNVTDPAGKQVGSVDLPASIFDRDPNIALMHQVVNAQLAAARQGTHSTKTRGRVRGGGKKPWRQKGTGRARQGSIRAPQWTGGGIVFAPKPRDYSYKIPKKVRRLALKSVLSSKVETEDMIVLDALVMEEASTKKAVETLKNIDAKEKAIVLVADGSDNVRKSFRNIPKVATLALGEINVYDLLKYDTVVLTKEAVQKIEEVYS